MGPIELLENLKDAALNFDMHVIYYLLFFSMLAVFFMGNRLCDSLIDYSEGVSMRDMFCHNRDWASLNFGVLFLCFAVFRSFKKKFDKKKENQIKKVQAK